MAFNFDLISTLIGASGGFLLSVYGMSINVKFQKKRELNDEIDKHLNELTDQIIYSAYFQDAKQNEAPTKWDFNLGDVYAYPPNRQQEYDKFNCVGTKEMINTLSSFPKKLSKPLRDIVRSYDLFPNLKTLEKQLFYEANKLTAVGTRTVYMNTDTMRFDKYAKLEFYPVSDSIHTFSAFHKLINDYVNELKAFRNLPWYKVIFTKL